jgi:hypothetical protein
MRRHRGLQRPGPSFRANAKKNRNGLEPVLVRLGISSPLKFTLCSYIAHGMTLSFDYEPSPEQSSLETAQERLSRSPEYRQDVRESPAITGQATGDGRYFTKGPRYSVPVVAGRSRPRLEGLAAAGVFDQHDQVLPDCRDRAPEARVLDRPIPR